MKVIKLFTLVALVCLVLSGLVSAQICGDADGNGTLNILDIAITLDHIAGVPNGIVLANADCDGVSGVTISDVVALSGEFFGNGTANCNLTGSYSLAPALNDTIFIPYMSNIPANVDVAYLLVSGSLSDITNAIYVPLLENGAGSNGLFTLDGVFGRTQTLSGGIVSEPNKRVTYSVEFFEPDVFDGIENLNLLKYSRVSPGIANIAPEAYDRESPWEISLVRNYDLFAPVISYYEIDGGSPGLQFSEDILEFHALANMPSADTQTVDISQGSKSIAYSLSTLTPWIEILEPNGVTPATVSITTDATGLGVLEYTGSVFVLYEGFTPVVDTLEVTLTVHPLGDPTFPAGDVNCDEALNILDLTYMVDYFFRGGLVPFPCE